MSASPRRGRALRLLVGGVIGILVACATIEVAGRVHARSKGTPWSARSANEQVAAAYERLLTRDWRIAPAASRHDRRDQAQVLHPYVGYDSIHMQKSLPALAHSTRRESAAEVYELGIVGGSVSCIVVQHSGDRLAALLEASPKLAGRRVRVHSLGQAAFKQPQQVMSIQWSLANGLRLDAVVNIDGFNEVAVANQNATSGCHPLYPYLPVWQHAVLGRATSDAGLAAFARMRTARDSTRAWCIRVKDSPLLHSAVVGRWMVARANLGVRDYFDAHHEYVGELVQTEKNNAALFGPPHAAGLDAVLATSIEAWVQGSLSLDAICEARGTRYLHVLQPTLHDHGSKPLTAEERATGAAPESWEEAVPVGYPRLRAEGDRLRDLGIDFLDASYVFAEDTRTLYYDNCHFGREGCDVLVERIAEHFLASMQ
jgi:hypothetical protein